MKKYRNVPTHVDGIRFDSKKEARRYGELKQLEKAGEIHGLQVHPVFQFEHRGHPEGKYTADFLYQVPGKGMVVEDVKSEATRKDRLYVRNKMQLRAHYGLEVTEV